MKRLILLVSALVLLVPAVPASAETAAPWPVPGSPPLPPDLTVPYLPAVGRVICGGGELSCFYDLQAELVDHTAALGCDHDAIFSDAYLTITRALIDVTAPGGLFDRPERVTHEAGTYAQEYFDQYDRWHSGDRVSVSPSWGIALPAAGGGGPVGDGGG